VIEDNRDAAESLRLLLEVLGHQVEVAHAGAAGIDAALAHVPEIVLCDIGLAGGMDGYEVARTLRAQLPPAVHLIAISGYGQDEDKARASAAGFSRHLTKPVDPDTLQQLLDDLL
jgi:CheY-like chemotaxis protein